MGMLVRLHLYCVLQARQLTAKRRALAWWLRRTHTRTLNGEHECRTAGFLEQVISDFRWVCCGKYIVLPSLQTFSVIWRAVPLDVHQTSAPLAIWFRIWWLQHEGRSGLVAALARISSRSRWEMRRCREAAG